jgi:hypothetical protein
MSSLANPAYGLQELHADLEWFEFVRRGSDGETLFGPDR